MTRRNLRQNSRNENPNLVLHAQFSSIASQMSKFYLQTLQTSKEQYQSGVLDAFDLIRSFIQRKEQESFSNDTIIQNNHFRHQRMEHRLMGHHILNNSIDPHSGRQFNHEFGGSLRLNSININDLISFLDEEEKKIMSDTSGERIKRNISEQFNQNNNKITRNEIHNNQSLEIDNRNISKSNNSNNNIQSMNSSSNHSLIQNNGIIVNNNINNNEENDQCIDEDQPVFNNQDKQFTYVQQNEMKEFSFNEEKPFIFNQNDSQTESSFSFDQNKIPSFAFEFNQFTPNPWRNNNNRNSQSHPNINNNNTQLTLEDISPGKRNFDSMSRTSGSINTWPNIKRLRLDDFTMDECASNVAQS